MSFKSIFLFIFVSLFGCASSDYSYEITGKGWDDFEKFGMMDDFNEFLPLQFTDCGFYDTNDSRQNEDMRLNAKNCIKSSSAIGSAYRFAVRNIFHDSYVHKVVLYSPSKGFLLVEYSIVLDFSDHFLKARKCDSITTSFSPLFFEAEKCGKFDVSRWVNAD